MKRTALPFIASVLLWSLTAAGAESGSRNDIVLDHLWSPATPGGASTAAAYMSIANHGAGDDRLLGGSSPVAAKVEVHEMSMVGGVMSMHAVGGGLVIPAGKTVNFEPLANYHLMLTGLKTPLKEGTELPLTLEFAKAGPVHVNVPVLPLGSRGPAVSNKPAPMDHH